jgi:hypothetical protein
LLIRAAIVGPLLHDHPCTGRFVRHILNIPLACIRSSPTFRHRPGIALVGNHAKLLLMRKLDLFIGNQRSKA